MENAKNSFHVADYCVFGAVLLISLGIGLYHALSGGKQKTKGEYLMGNHQMSLLPVSISILVSIVSSNTILGVSAEMYHYGIDHFFSIIGSIAACVVTALTFVPLLYPLKLTSCYEYLELRFRSPLPRKLASLILIVKQIFYIGCVLFGPATALEAVTGLSSSVSIVTVTVVSTLYTTLGGIKAVIYTDVLQSGFMLAGMLAVVIKGAIQVGGLQEVFSISKEDGRINLNRVLRFNPTQRLDVYSLVFGALVYGMGEYGINQPAAQRYCALKSLTQARISMLLFIPGCLIIWMLSCLSGFVSYAYFAQTGCDPLDNGEITNPNQVLALFTMEVLRYPGLPGLMLACIFSGSLSTVSSSFNSMAACVWEDFLITKLGHIRESKITVIMKMIVVAFGVTCLGMAFLAKNIGGTMMQLAGSFVGVALGPMVGMFFLGGALTFTEAWGAVTGGIAGLAVPLWMLFGYLMLGLCNPGIPGRTDVCHLPANQTVTNSSFYLILEEATTSTILNSSDCTTGLSEMAKEPLAAIHQFYSISFAWYPAVGFLVTIAVGIVVSIVVNLVFGRHPPVDKELLFPVLRLCLKDAETQINENMDGPVNDQNISLLNLKMKDLKQVKKEFQNGSI